MISNNEKDELKKKIRLLKAEEDSIRDKSPEKENIRKNQERSKMMGYSHLGIEFGLAIILPVLLGNYLDKKFDLSPVLLITGLILGFSAGLIRLVKITSQMNDDE